MDLVLNDYPSRLTKDKGMFCIKNEEGMQKLSPFKVRSISLTRACMLSTDAILLAMKHEIPIILHSPEGTPRGRMYGTAYGSISKIRRQQVLFSTTTAATDWLIERIILKSNRQIQLLKNMNRGKKKKMHKVAVCMDNMKLHKGNISSYTGKPIKAIADSLRGTEGNIHKHYFQGLSYSVPKDYKFENRSRRPAGDIFNAMLNYSYGILYKELNSVLLQAGLDPYLSIFHQAEHKRPALSLDFIEPYRPWADAIVCRICRKRLVLPGQTQKIKKGIWLDPSARKTIILEFNGFLNQKVEYGQKRLKRRFHLKEEAHSFAKFLLSLES